MITIEKFDPNKFDVEKLGHLRIYEHVINISEGYIISDVFEDLNLPESDLWSSDSAENLRLIYWHEIQKFLPKIKIYYLKNNIDSFIYHYKDCKYLHHLMILIQIYKIYGKLKLIYISDEQKAQLIKRVLEYLISQIKSW